MQRAWRLVELTGRADRTLARRNRPPARLRRTAHSNRGNPLFSAMEAAGLVDVEAEVAEHIDVILAEPEQVKRAVGGLRDDSKRMHAQVVDLAEIEDDLAQPGKYPAQFQRLRQVEGAAQPEQHQGADSFLHHLQSHVQNDANGWRFRQLLSINGWCVRPCAPSASARPDRQA